MMKLKRIGAAKLVQRAVASFLEGAEALRELLREHGEECRCEFCEHVRYATSPCVSEWWDDLRAAKVLLRNAADSTMSYLEPSIYGE